MDYITGISPSIESDKRIIIVAIVIYCPWSKRHKLGKLEIHLSGGLITN